MGGCLPNCLVQAETSLQSRNNHAGRLLLSGQNDSILSRLRRSNSLRPSQLQCRQTASSALATRRRLNQRRSVHPPNCLSFHQAIRPIHPATTSPIRTRLPIAARQKHQNDNRLRHHLIRASSMRGNQPASKKKILRKLRTLAAMRCGRRFRERQTKAPASHGKWNRLGKESLSARKIPQASLHLVNSPRKRKNGGHGIAGSIKPSDDHDRQEKRPFLVMHHSPDKRKIDFDRNKSTPIFRFTATVRLPIKKRRLGIDFDLNKNHRPKKTPKRITQFL